MSKVNNYQTRACRENDIKTIESYKLHKFLFAEKKYAITSNKAKLSYMLYINKFMRTHKSKNSNRYIDEDNKKFVIYTNKDLSNILSCSPSTVKRAKQELIDVGLIKVVKTKGQKESRIYPQNPDIHNTSLTYINKDNEVKLTYYSMPKFLFNNDFYKTIDLETKILYPILKDRYTSSLINSDTKKPCKFKDERGRIFCIYTNTELGSLLNLSEPRIIESKKQLVVLGLLKQISITQKGTNRLYVYTPLNYEQMTVEDIQQDLTNEKKKYVLRPPEKAMRVQRYSRLGFKKDEHQGSNIKHKDTSFKDTSSKDTLINDMYGMYSKEIANLNHSNHSYNNQNNKFENEQKEVLLQNYPSILKGYLLNYTCNDIVIIKNVFNKGKKHFNNNYNTEYRFEDVETLLVDMLKRINIKITKQKETIKETQGLIMSSLINVFKDYDKEVTLNKLENLFDQDTDTYVETFEKFIEKNTKNTFFNNKFLPSSHSNNSVEVNATEEELNALGVF